LALIDPAVPCPWNGSRSDLSPRGRAWASSLKRLQGVLRFFFAGRRKPVLDFMPDRPDEDFYYPLPAGMKAGGAALLISWPNAANGSSGRAAIAKSHLPWPHAKSCAWKKVTPASQARGGMLFHAKLPRRPAGVERSAADE